MTDRPSNGTRSKILFSTRFFQRKVGIIKCYLFLIRILPLLISLDLKPVDGLGDHDGLGLVDAEPNFKTTMLVSRPRLLY